MKQAKKLTIWQDICENFENGKIDIAYMIFSNTIEELSALKTKASTEVEK